VTLDASKRAPTLIIVRRTPIVTDRPKTLRTLLFDECVDAGGELSTVNHGFQEYKR